MNTGARPRRMGGRPGGSLQGVKLGWMTGIEPATTGATVQCSTIELHPPHVFRQVGARLEGIEPPTDGLEIRCSIQLSYRRPTNYGCNQSRCALEVHFAPGNRPEIERLHGDAGFYADGSLYVDRFEPA